MSECTLIEGALNHLIQVIDEDIKQGWTQHWSL